MLVTKLMIKLAKSADQNPVTSKALLQRAVSINIAALTTNINNPKVIKVAGKVRTLTREPKNALIRPKSRATQR